MIPREKILPPGDIFSIGVAREAVYLSRGGIGVHFGLRAVSREPAGEHLAPFWRWARLSWGVPDEGVGVVRKPEELVSRFVEGRLEGASLE